MKTVTLRNLPPELKRSLEKRAAKEGSANLAVIALLGEALGVPKPRKSRPVYHDLDRLAGSWSREEAARFERNLAEGRKIDPEVWAP